MADSENATRAPESDAAEQSLFPGDTPAQTGPTVGEHCVTDRPTPSSSEAPTGEVTKIGDVKCYVSKPSDYPHAPSKLLLLLTGGTGIHSRNNQLQADKYAAEGFLVVMPDQFNGDASPTSATIPTSPSTQTQSWLDTIKIKAAETAKAFQIDMWLARHTPETVLPLVHNALDGAKELYADAVANGDGVYAVGYCFGAKYAMLLAGVGPPGGVMGEVSGVVEEGRVKKGPFVKAVAIAHGTQIDVEDIAGVRVPISMVCVEDDPLFPKDVLEKGVKALEAGQVKHEVTTYPGVPHGFAVVGDYAEDHIKTEQGKAWEQMLAWLQAH